MIGSLLMKPARTGNESVDMPDCTNGWQLGSFHRGGWNPLGIAGGIRALEAEPMFPNTVHPVATHSA